MIYAENVPRNTSIRVNLAFVTGHLVVERLAKDDRARGSLDPSSIDDFMALIVSLSCHLLSLFQVDIS